MKKVIISIGTILTLGTALIALNFGGMAGCGSSSNNSAAATTTNANAAGAAASSTALTALTAASGSALVVSDHHKSQIIDSLKDAITISETGSCSEGSVPSPLGTLINSTIQGSDIDTGGTGSCTVKADGTATSLSALIDCNNLSLTETVDSADVTVVQNGQIGFSATETGSTFNMDIGSHNLKMTLGGDSCDVKLNLSLGVTNGATSGTVSISGCVSVCGQAFSASGSETF